MDDFVLWSHGAISGWTAKMGDHHARYRYHTPMGTGFDAVILDPAGEMIESQSFQPGSEDFHAARRWVEDRLRYHAAGHHWEVVWDAPARGHYECLRCDLTMKVGGSKFCTASPAAVAA